MWFGEVPFHLVEIERALHDCTHFLAIGTSGKVWPAAGMLSSVWHSAEYWGHGLGSRRRTPHEQTIDGEGGRP